MPPVSTTGFSTSVSISRENSQSDNNLFPASSITNSQIPPNHHNATSQINLNGGGANEIRSNVRVYHALSPNDNEYQNTIGAGLHILDQSIPSLSDPEKNEQLLRKALGHANILPNVSNATMNSGDYARLSQHFQPINRPILTPIPSRVIQPMPLYTTANNHGGVQFIVGQC